VNKTKKVDRNQTAKASETSGVDIESNINATEEAAKSQNDSKAASD
jgi:hypothetical protein